MKLTKRNPIQVLVNDFIIDSPAPTNLTYFWNFGSILGVNLVIQIVSGLTLAMHYTPNTLLAFSSVEHIMRDVNNGWLIRYIHANGASFFFINVYLHIGRNLFYGSYRSPRGLLWSIGVVIFIVMMATAFMGYVLPWGQIEALNGQILSACYFPQAGLARLAPPRPACLGQSRKARLVFKPQFDHTRLMPWVRRVGLVPLGQGQGANGHQGPPKISTSSRIGPHNIDIISVLVGNQQGDGYGELRSGSPRFSIHMGSPNMEYLYWLHRFYSERGYCSAIVPTFKIQIGKGSILYRSARFHTYTFSSLLWLYELFYIDKVKIMPSNIADYLTPLALAIWIMDDGGKRNAGLMISTYNFTYQGLLIVKAGLFNKYGLVVEIKKLEAGYILVFQPYEMKLLVSLVYPFFIPSMLYKLHGNRYLS